MTWLFSILLSAAKSTNVVYSSKLYHQRKLERVSKKLQEHVGTSEDRKWGGLQWHDANGKFQEYKSLSGPMFMDA
jgi:hypothetical protein